MKINQLRITLLGSGTSTGVPLLGCQCRVCTSKDPKNKRLRVSVWLQLMYRRKQIQSWLIDVSPDFREQALRSKISRIDAILFTHPHADHVGGVDDLRAYNFFQKERLQAYGSAWTLKDLPKRYPYIFKKTKIEGGGVSQVDLNYFNEHATKFVVNGVSVIPLPAAHGSQTSVGFRVGSFAYLTDCNFIPQSTINRMKNLDLLILDCARDRPHPTHLNTEQALHYAQQIRAKKTVLTHMGHEIEHKSFSKHLPKSVSLAYDQKTFQLTFGV